MKVILTGPTGFIGSEVLTQCRNDKRITEIIALTRRPLDEEVEQDTKMEVVEMKDFSVYSEETLKKMEGADACIWYFSPNLVQF
jgi:NAD dependent epimerase/dehydratase family enzyme